IAAVRNELLYELSFRNVDRHLVLLEVAIEELHRAPPEVGDRVHVNPSPIAGVGEMREMFQLFRERVDANARPRLYLANRQATQTFELRHQLHALHERSVR